MVLISCMNSNGKVNEVLYACMAYVHNLTEDGAYNCVSIYYICDIAHLIFFFSVEEVIVSSFSNMKNVLEYPLKLSRLAARFNATLFSFLSLLSQRSGMNMCVCFDEQRK